MWFVFAGSSGSVCVIFFLVWVQDYGREKSSGIGVDGHDAFLMIHTPNAPPHSTNPTWRGEVGHVGLGCGVGHRGVRCGIRRVRVLGIGWEGMGAEGGRIGAYQANTKLQICFLNSFREHGDVRVHVFPQKELILLSGALPRLAL